MEDSKLYASTFLLAFTRIFCPMLASNLHRYRKCFYAACALVLFVSAYNLVTFLSQARHAPGSIDRSPRFHLSHVAEQYARPVIMVTYPGRLGNHMFQYATLIGVARRNDMIPVIPHGAKLLDLFKLPAQRGDTDLLGDSYYVYTEEKSATYFNATERLKPFNTLLNGYFQSWKYFENMHSELLRKHFVFRDEIADQARSFLNAALALKAKRGAVLIGVHVRRGDFVRRRLMGYSAAPLSYFYRAMNYFRERFGNVLFIVCSSDVLWAEDNLDVGPDVYYSKNADGRVDMAVLASCDHMIITAGSYSWWAGYLVRGLVLYYKGYPQPNTFIGNETVRADYYPRRWIPM